MRKDILIVDDSRFLSATLTRRIEAELNRTVIRCASLAQTKEYFENNNAEFLAALVAVTLPDAPDGEAVTYVRQQDIPTIVFTGGFSEDTRDKLLHTGIVDYVLKDSPGALDGIIATLDRLDKNRQHTILIVDDSATARSAMHSLLQRSLFNTVGLPSAEDALEYLQQHPDEISLVITDHNMEGMNGFTMVREIRKTWKREQLPIVGISAQDSPILAVQFIKNGANDFLHKPFLMEEFYCRITQIVETQEHIELIREMSEKDHLTRLYNRRYFFEHAPGYIKRLATAEMPCTVAMLDIDHFKSVNDAYGHDGGDLVLKQISHLLSTAFKGKGIVCRFGGEEFCVLTESESSEKAMQTFEGVRKAIENTPIDVGTKIISVTVSIGICNMDEKSIDESLKIADDRLYKAKRNGRNRVVAS